MLYVVCYTDTDGAVKCPRALILDTFSDKQYAEDWMQAIQPNWPAPLRIQEFELDELREIGWIPRQDG